MAVPKVRPQPTRKALQSVGNNAPTGACNMRRVLFFVVHCVPGGELHVCPTCGGLGN